MLAQLVKVILILNEVLDIMVKIWTSKKMFSIQKKPKKKKWREKFKITQCK